MEGWARAIEAQQQAAAAAVAAVAAFCAQELQNFAKVGVWYANVLGHKQYATAQNHSKKQRRLQPLPPAKTLVSAAPHASSAAVKAKASSQPPPPPSPFPFAHSLPSPVHSQYPVYTPSPAEQASPYDYPRYPPISKGRVLVWECVWILEALVLGAGDSKSPQ